MKFAFAFAFSLTCSIAFAQLDTSRLVVGVDLKAMYDTTDIFRAVEIPASYAGDWRKYLTNNLKANVPVKNGAPAGTYNVVVRFIVDKDGNLFEISALTKHGYGMEEEVIRVIKKSGKWNPAIQGGRFVRAWRTQPVTFVIAPK